MTSILLPALVLMIVTFLVWLNMFVKRIISFKANNTDINYVVTPEKLNEVLDEAAKAPGNCLKNLFELPVIFYAICAYLAITGLTDAVYINLAWAFVAFRSLQAIVHCTYNIVMHRFIAYFVSSILLWVMVIRLFLSFI